MKNFLLTIQKWLNDSDVTAKPTQRVQVHRQYLPARAGSRRPTVLVVQRDPRPYWQERRWRQDGGIYQGNYQTVFGSWAGYITVSPGGRVEVFIHNPPQALQRHSHWDCFQARNDGWYFVHPVWPVADVSAGIMGVEKTINEAYAL